MPIADTVSASEPRFTTAAGAKLDDCLLGAEATQTAAPTAQAQSPRRKTHRLMISYQSLILAARIPRKAWEPDRAGSRSVASLFPRTPTPFGS